MTPALTPELALDYLRELSADVRDGVVLGPGGDLLAGPAQLAALVRRLLDAAPEAQAVEVAIRAGTVFAARSDRHAVALVCGPYAITSLALHDLGTVLDELAGNDRAGAAPR
jgi:hypothetical protein